MTSRTTGEKKKEEQVSEELREREESTLTFKVSQRRTLTVESSKDIARNF